MDNQTNQNENNSTGDYKKLKADVEKTHAEIDESGLLRAEKELIRAIIQGDKSTIDELIDRYATVESRAIGIIRKVDQLKEFTDKEKRDLEEIQPEINTLRERLGKLKREEGNTETKRDRLEEHSVELARKKQYLTLVLEYIKHNKTKPWRKHTNLSLKKEKFTKL